MLLLLFFAFLSGLVTIAAPCIWPLLPIILSASTTGGHRKPLGITLGIITSFSFFTLSISYLVSLFHFDPNNLRLVAVVIIVFLGVAMIVPGFMSALEGVVSRISGKFAGQTTQPKTGFLGGFVTGLSLGIVWSPCAGPILATIATLAATQSVTIQTVLVTFSYSLGVGIPLFFFSTFGSVLFTQSRVLSKYLGRIQQVFGVIMLVTALAIYTNYDKLIQVKLLDLFPSYSSFLTSFETNNVVTQQLQDIRKIKDNMQQSEPDVSGQKKAAAFVGITHWLNLPAGKQVLTLDDLKGKVVLVDFWTYTCINCIRTLPYVTQWYDKYKDKGFVVIGVHTPEFAFEKETTNVEQAIKQYNIHYPIAQDNDYTTWTAYQNQYWPAEYLIDAKGIIRHTHFGEGEYDKTEAAIQELLKEAGNTVSSDMVKIQDQTPSGKISPETYFGSARAQFYFPSGQIVPGKKEFKLDETIPLNTYSFGGVWKIAEEMSVPDSGSTLAYHFEAGQVYAIFRPDKAQKTSGKVKVYLDGSPISADVAGKDVSNGVVTVDYDRLYHLVDLKKTPGEHVLKLEFLTPGISVYTFTFG